MIEHLMLELAAVAVLGISAQWIGWRFSIPSILLLLLFGIIAGPVSGLLTPSAMLGDLLYPIVSLAVAIILFEGGLSLTLKEFQAVGGTVARLVSIGTAVTWVLTAVFAHFLLELDWALAVLLGGILVVTGPTVTIPLLRHIRPSGQVGSILKWEGIVIDPIGAMLAVLVFQVIIATDSNTGTLVVSVLFQTLLVGVTLGMLAAGALIQIVKHDWAPDYLQNPVTVMLVVATFAVSNLLQHESGLLAVTVMGFALANQKQVSIAHIIEFKESLRVMLIAVIFILLAANLDPEQIAGLGVGSLLFLLLLIGVVRPAAVFASTIGSNVSHEEKLFLSWLAPRGIVAAAVSSVFALRLEEVGHPGADILVPTTFFVIIGTVTIYGLTASRLASRLGLAKADPNGVLLLGGRPWVREIAKALQSEGIMVLMVDNVRANVRAARLEGVPSFHASVFSENILEQVELGGIGRLLALDANDDVNSLAALHFAPIFGRNHIFQLAPDDRPQLSNEDKEHNREEHTSHLRARTAFTRGLTHAQMTVRYASGWVVKKNKLTNEFTYKDLERHYDGNLLPLFKLSDGKLAVVHAEARRNFASGTTLISMVKPSEQQKGKTKPKAKPRESTDDPMGNANA